MPQMLLPFFPKGVTYINSLLAFQCVDEEVHYFNGFMPIFHHRIDDIKSFYMIVSQFYVNGIAKQSDIARAFGVSPVSLKRAAKIYREEGISGFYKPRKTGGGARVLTPEIIEKIQPLLDEGKSPAQIAKKLKLKCGDTIQKAITDGRLKKKALL
jgi:transposase-like protein